MLRGCRLGGLGRKVYFGQCLLDRHLYIFDEPEYQKISTND